MTACFCALESGPHDPTTALTRNVFRRSRAHSELSLVQARASRASVQLHRQSLTTSPALQLTYKLMKMYNSWRRHPCARRRTGPPAPARPTLICHRLPTQPQPSSSADLPSRTRKAERQPLRFKVVIRLRHALTSPSAAGSEFTSAFSSPLLACDRYRRRWCRQTRSPLPARPPSEPKPYRAPGGA